MPNTASEGKCDNCGELRSEHSPDDEGLRLRCADGGRFAWPRCPTRAGTSFNALEVRALDALVAHAAGHRREPPRTPPEVLLSLRRKTLAMRKKIESS